MKHLPAVALRTRRLIFVTAFLGLAAAAALGGSRSDAAQKKQPKKGQPPASKPIAPPPPRSSLLTHEAWQNAPLTRLQPGELDELVNKELQNSKVEPAPLTSDEQFIRRVTLDLTGQTGHCRVEVKLKP